jgi:hypothetical protein
MINWIVFAVPRVMSVVLGFTRSVPTLLSESSYRPELHYMRGPGPKWREKHQAGADLATP